MKKIFLIVAYIALAFVIIAPCMFFADVISQNVMMHIMFVTAIVWFAGMLAAKSKKFNKT